MENAISDYQRDGYLAPIPVVSEAEATATGQHRRINMETVSFTAMKHGTKADYEAHLHRGEVFGLPVLVA